MADAILYHLTSNSYAYLVNGVLFDAETLAPMVTTSLSFPSNVETTVPIDPTILIGRSQPILSVRQILPQLTSRLLILRTDSFTDLAAVVDYNNRLRIISSISPLIIDDRVTSIAGPFQVPDINRIPSGLTRLTPLNLGYTQHFLETLENLIENQNENENENNRLTVRQLNNMDILSQSRDQRQTQAQPQIQIPPQTQVRPQSPQSPQHPQPPQLQPQSQPDTLTTDVLRALVVQLYGIPVQLPEYLVINGLRVNFVPFAQIASMLSQNQIERYIIDPLLQPFAGSPGTPYRIFTFFGKNGITYLVKARYDTQTNQILP